MASLEKLPPLPEVTIILLACQNQSIEIYLHILQRLSSFPSDYTLLQSCPNARLLSPCYFWPSLLSQSLPCPCHWCQKQSFLSPESVCWCQFGHHSDNWTTLCWKVPQHYTIVCVYSETLYVYINRCVPGLREGGGGVAIGGAVRRLGSVVIRSTFGVCMCALYLGGVQLWRSHAGYAPVKYMYIYMYVPPTPGSSRDAVPLWGGAVCYSSRSVRADRDWPHSTWPGNYLRGPHHATSCPCKYPKHYVSDFTAALIFIIIIYTCSYGTWMSCTMLLICDIPRDIELCTHYYQ